MSVDKATYHRDYYEAEIKRLKAAQEASPITERVFHLKIFNKEQNAFIGKLNYNHAASVVGYLSNEFEHLSSEDHAHSAALLEAEMKKFKEHSNETMSAKQLSNKTIAAFFTFNLPDAIYFVNSFVKTEN